MEQLEKDVKDTIVMKLLHYFITEKNYNPVILQGAKNEIWLENMKENYKIVRIVSEYIHNDEQLDFDLFKAKKVGKSIKAKTFSFDMNILSIYMDLGDNAHIEKNNRNMMLVKISDEDDLKNLDVLQDDFPDIRKKLKFTEKGMELFLKITEDINKKNQTDARHVDEVFEKKTPYVSYTLIAINVLIYFVSVLFGKYDDIINTFCLYGPFVRMGDYYRLFTSMFLHGDILHLFFNCYALYVIGPQLESFMGKVKFLFIYIFSGILGGFLSIAMSNYASIGASGAIFGLLGGMLYFGYHYRLYLGSVLKSQIIPLIVLNLVLGFMNSGIDNFAHIGGLIGGVLATSVVGVKYKSSKSEQINGTIITIILTIFIAYIALVLKG